LSNLVDDLLDLSHITSREFIKQGVDLSNMASEVLAELQEAEPLREAKFKIAPDLQVRGDVALLQSALHNLLENAWKFSSKEAQDEIEVGRTTVEGETVFFVRDNGVGFNMAYAKNLFGAFQRLHRVNELPAPISAWPRCSALSTATADGSGRKAKWVKTLPFISL
jgi:light-regulated signal transduction histidine kinase (bacteriophytochrome)